MDTWKFYDITHREHVVCNPTSNDKLARLVGLLRLPAEARVVDIACGKGEFLIRLAEAYGDSVESGLTFHRSASPTHRGSCRCERRGQRSSSVR